MNIRRNGTVRSQRLNKGLLESPFKIDQRSFWDIMGYMSSYLEKINYYNLNDLIDGNWKTLLESDPVIYMVIIINEPIDNFELKIKNQLSSKHPTLESDRDIMATLVFWYSKIQKWHDNVSNLGEDKLAHKINNVLVDVLNPQKKKLATYREYLAKTREISKKGGRAKKLPEPPKNDVDLADSLHNFLRVIIHIQEFTKEYLERRVLYRNDHMPNNAMYIAFTILYKSIQDKINAQSKNHLDFYYKEILQQKNSKGRPTSTIVSFDLKPTVNYSHLDKGILLSAGKLFGSKTDITFKTNKPLVLHQIELKEMQTLLLSSSPYISAGTNKSLVSSIQKKKLLAKGKESCPREDWFVFGANKQTAQNVQVIPDKVADIGFVIGSPVLELQEGVRKISIRFNLETKTSTNVFWKLLNEIKDNRGIKMSSVIYQIFGDSFKMSYTSKKGWEPFAVYGIEFDEKQNYFTIQLTLQESDPTLELSSKIPEKLSWPSISVELNEYAPIYAYSFFRTVQMDSIDISVEASRIKNLSLYNNIGKISPDKAFDMFGPVPLKGSFLMIGNGELFQKQILDLEIDIEWESLPEDYGGFDTYYQGYSQPICNDSFNVMTTALSGSYWLPTNLSNAKLSPLFSTVDCITPKGYNSVQLAPTSKITFPDFGNLVTYRNYNPKTPLTYDINTQNGFIKLTLTSPDCGFGGDLYFKDYTDIATFNAKNKVEIPLPNKPIVPKVSALTLSYKASDTLIFNNQRSKPKTPNENVAEYFHITAYGLQYALINGIVKKNTILCDFHSKGYLFLGLSGVNSNTSVSMYFHFLRSSTSIEMVNNTLTWEYFHGNGWTKFDDGEITLDNTSGFTKSGIVEMILPRIELFGKEENKLFWIRISTTNGMENYPKIKGIYINAVEVTCTSTDPNIVGKVFPEGSITKIEGKFPDIKKVSQPADSGKGVLAESGNQLYTRVSERLRHKYRAVSIWDYERLILENFDGVKVAKCTSFDKDFKQVPGSVKVIALSKKWKGKERHYFSNNILSQMTSFLKKRSSSLIDIEVMNPSPEYLLVNCVVEFMPEDNGGYYYNKLNSDISEFLSPISEIDNGVGGIGGSVVPTMLTSFLENLPYLMNVVQLSIEHIVRKGTNNYTLGVYEHGEEINATTPWSILSPSSNHNILSLVGSEQVPLDYRLGISELEIGTDFIIGDNVEIDGETEAESKDSDSKNIETSSNSIFVFKHKM